ncbi:hypothetical protein BWR56_1391 [Streptococcus oralis]|nr:hypothetical protein BWR56_1391 [Streptococcus oralis]
MSRFLEATQAFEKYQKTISLFKRISKNQLKTFPKNVEFLHLCPKLLPAKKERNDFLSFTFPLILNYEKTYF